MPSCQRAFQAFLKTYFVDPNVDQSDKREQAESVPLHCPTSLAKHVGFRRSPFPSALNKNSLHFETHSCFSTRKMHYRLV